MPNKRPTRRRNAVYKTLPFTIDKDKIKKLDEISARFFACRSAAIERGVDLLFDAYGDKN